MSLFADSGVAMTFVFMSMSEDCLKILIKVVFKRYLTDRSTLDSLVDIGLTERNFHCKMKL